MSNDKARWAMKAISRTLLVVTLALVATFAWPKSQTIKLEIVGPGLIEPLEITDRALLDRFNIWNGPGVRVNDRPIHLEPVIVSRSVPSSIGREARYGSSLTEALSTR